MSVNSLEALSRVSAKSDVAGAVERTTGAIFLAAAGPGIAIAGAAICLLSRRSPFIAHLRVGEGGRPFWMWKLRTMWPQAGSRPAAMGWVEYIIAEPSGDGKDPQDRRVSSGFARFLRRHSIDEMPQLWHVARGEMSFVGPRPMTKTEVSKYYGARAGELLSVKPGLTGIWQISGRNNIKFPERAALDLELVNGLTPWSYVTIMVRTVAALFHGKGAC